MDRIKKAAKTIDFNRAKVSSTYKDISRQILDTNDAVTRAIRRLQTSLEISSLIDIFMQELSALMRPGQLRYQSPNGDTYSFGKDSGSHSCQFNLAIENLRLGKLSISRRQRFSEEEISIVEFMASTLVFPLKNALSYQEALANALTDEMTGLGNKRAMKQGLDREIERAIRRKHPLAAIMLDIDHFKAINDSFGHGVGDDIIKQVAELIREKSRKSDLCYRYGGEEFLLLLDETDKDQAIRTAERLRKAVEEHVFFSDEKTVSVSISLWCTLFDAEEQAPAFIQRADKALYAAKRSGRNNTRYLESELEAAF